MKQETAFSMFCGALLAAVAYGVYKGGKRAVEVAGDLSRGLVGIGVLAEHNEKLAENSAMVGLELQMLRNVISGNAEAQQVQTPGAEADPDGGFQPPAAGPGKLNPFPRKPPTMYRAADPEEEAPLEDLVVGETDDKKMAEYEKLEMLRQTGAEVDSEELDAELQGNV